MAGDDLEERLSLVRRAVERSSEPLDVPLGLDFRPRDGTAHLKAWAEHADRARGGAVFPAATLYAHVPFCARVCTYCLLSAVRTPGRDAVRDYVEAMKRQIAMYEPLVRGLRFGSLHLGGGTPTLLDEGQLDELMTALSRFERSPDAQIGVEAHPGTSTPGRLAVLRRHGVDRLSFGVESMTPEVLRQVNREDQNEGRVRAAVAEARKLGFSVNLDLLAGLPGETDATWETTVLKTLELEPDSLSVNRFLGENSLLARFGFGPGPGETHRVSAMLRRADALIRERSSPRWPEEPLAVPGFGTQYVWDRSGGARRYFQDDMIGPVSTLAIGQGALGHVHARHFSVSAGGFEEYVESLTRGEHPAMLECPVDARFEMAFFAADQASRGALGLRDFQRAFGMKLGHAFPEETRYLLERGLLVLDGDRIRKPSDLTFQMTHLLAFLLSDAPTLRARLEGLAPRAVAGEPAEAAGVLRVDVGSGLDAGAATELASREASSGRRLEILDDGRRPISQYAGIEAELPPSMLWVRLAVRAAQAGRGEQRHAVDLSS